MLGAVIILVTGIVPFGESLDHIDFNTIGVLVGMMLFVAVTKRSGLFECIAIRSAKLAKGDPWLIMSSLMLVTAVLSAFLDNVTTVLLVGPMTLMICRRLDLDPVPFFITQIIASNIGGTATLIGDPPNIMIGSKAGFSFLDFILVDAPIAAAILFATLLCFQFMYKGKFKVDEKYLAVIMELNERDAVSNRALFVKSVVMVVLVAAAFILHGALHLEPAVIALSAASVMMLIGRQSVEEIVLDVEWATIGFFGGLFIVVGGMVETGVIDSVAWFLVDITHGQELFAILVILVASAIISSVLDNIPFVATMIPVLLTMQQNGIDATPLWWALSLGACLGGNGTLVGASANVVLSGISNREGHQLTFLQFFKVGFPLMLLSVIMAGIYLVIRFQ
jgi:Na+/H+ antiporter NhaD/arsenite permease-like protein